MLILAPWTPQSVGAAAAMALLLLVCGCGDKKTVATKTQKEKSPKTGPTVEQIKTAGLPALEKPFPVGPAGEQIEVARPQGWSRAVTTRQGTLYLCRRSSDQEYPRIYVLADDAAGEESVTTANVQQFAQQLADKQRGNKSLIGDVSGLVVGDFAAASYVSLGRVRRNVGGKTQSVKLHSKRLITIFSGRRYTLELQALPGTLDAFTPNLYAMAAGLNFSPQDVKETPPGK